MARLPVQVTISIMMLSSLSSMLLSLSDAARADTFTKGKLSVLDVHSSAAVLSSSKNEADSQSAMEARPVRERVWNGIFETEEGRRRPVRDSVGTSHVTGNNDRLQRQSPTEPKSFLAFRSATWPADIKVEDEQLQLLQLVALMSHANIPALGMWQVTGDEEDNSRCRVVVLVAVLGGDIDQEERMSTEDIALRLKKINLTKSKALQPDISHPGMWQGNGDQMDTMSGKRALLADILPHAIWTDADVNESPFHKRTLLADISPPGMWSDDGDDMQDKYHKRRLLADISPPGMWQGSDDPLTDMAQK